MPGFPHPKALLCAIFVAGFASTSHATIPSTSGIKKLPSAPAKRVGTTNKKLAFANLYNAKGMDKWPKSIRSGSYQQVVELFRDFGRKVLKRAIKVRSRQRYIRWRCKRKNAPKWLCNIYWKSQRIFAINYRTRRSNYRGYLMFHRKNKKKIPRYLMRWYRRLADQKFWKYNGKCFQEQGFISNCFTFSLCTYKYILKSYRRGRKKSFGLPAWGVTHYWTAKAFLAHLNDYGPKKKKPGVRSLWKVFHKLSHAERLKRSRTLLSDIEKHYTAIVRRRSRSTSRVLYEKAFCTNILAGANNFSRAIPGDMFGLVRVYKRWRRQKDNYRYGFGHLGLIYRPKRNRVFHNQTPGGLWGTRYRRWGLQYGTYKKKHLNSKWYWKRKKRRWRKDIAVVHRVNLHYFMYANSRSISIFDRTNRNLCRQWIHAYAPLYFLNFNKVKRPPRRIWAD